MALSLADDLTAEGHFGIYRLYSDGRRELRQQVKNIVVNQGLFQMLDNAIGSGAIIDYFAWGRSGVDVNGSPVAKVAASSGLTTQNGSKAIASTARSANVLNVYGTIATTEGNTPGSINEFGLFASGTEAVNRFFAMQSFATELKDSTFALQFEYALTLNQV